MKKETASELNLAGVLKGFIYTVVISLLLILLVGLLFYLTPLSEKYLSTVSLAVIFASVFGGGWIASKNAASKGLIHGTLVAIIFLLFNLTLTALMGGVDLTAKLLLMKALASLLGGGMGGIVGVGFNNQ